jgi:HipA-like kinase
MPGVPGLRTVTATRYVTPLREGGSLPALVEADDDGLYVVKFRGAGQGPKALAAEIVAGEVARALGLPVPELVLVELDPQLADAEPDPEIQELLAASAGLNVGVDFLPGALPYAPAYAPDTPMAADVVWFDALVLNVDRTPRNPNLLRWHGRTWLIDHGAALYVHHGGGDVMAQAGAPFAPIREHVLLPAAGSIEEADERLAGVLDRAALDEIAGLVPDGWTGGAPYAEHLAARLAERREWVAAAEEARQAVAARRFERDEEADRGRA